jgi:uncharacterized protein (TIGR03000 family)
MMKRWLPVVALVAVALVLADAGTSQAQRLFGRNGWMGNGWGGWGWGGNSAWTGYTPAYGLGYNYSGYWPNTFAYGNYGTWPNTYGYNAYNYGMSPYYYGTSPYYNGTTYTYNAPTYTGSAYVYGTPTYTGGTTLYSPSSYALMPQNYMSFYPPNFPQGSPAVGSTGFGTTANSNQALVEVRVPANAQVWFDGDPTQQRGTDRMFVSPPLQSGKRYHYDVKAQWNENGRTVDKTRTVHVEPGAHVTVDFFGAGSDRGDLNNDRNQDRNLDRNNDTNRTQDRTPDRTNRTPER